MPGDRGSTFIDLHNNGTGRGIVYIWIDNLSTSDRQGNPGGGLANYMYFNVSGSHLNSTLILPGHINSFPTSPLLPAHFIIIDSFDSGDTIRLNWTWEFKETGQPQNDAQNNSLGFNLSYTLVNLSAPIAPTVIPTAVPTGITTGGPGGGSRGLSLFGGGILPGLNPVQRPALRAPAEEIFEEESTQPVFPDHGNIMIIALIVLVIAVSVRSQYKKHPEWKSPAHILLGIGISLTIIGVLYQSYLISIRNGQHFTTTHSVAGIIATIFMIPVLVFWSCQCDQKHRGSKKILVIFIFWAVTVSICLFLGLRSVGVL